MGPGTNEVSAALGLTGWSRPGAACLAIRLRLGLANYRRRADFFAAFFFAGGLRAVFLAAFLAVFFAAFFLAADLSGAWVKAEAASFLISAFVSFSGVRKALLANEATALDVLSFLAMC